MDKNSDITTSPAIIEFVTVAMEYCATLEQVNQQKKDDFVLKMQKLLPLLYLKGALLPKVTSEVSEVLHSYVSEDDWNALFFALKKKLGKDNEYLEVFDRRIEDSDNHVVASLAENFSDIYQDLKNFLTNYSLGTEEIMQESLWELNESFGDFWGQYAVNALRAIHKIATTETDDDDGF